MIKSLNHKISVVMAAYNASSTVAATLDNLLGQTYKNIEIIVVNDASTDDTAAVVESYTQKNQNIKLVSLEKNVGPFRARVVGVDNATGTYLHFLDADDYLSGDFYELTLTQAISSKSDIVIGSIVLDFKNTGEIFDYPLINNLPFHELSNPKPFEYFMEQSGLNFTYHMNSTKLYSMSLWKKARPYYDRIQNHLIMADDVALNVPLWFFANKIIREPKATLFYVKDDNDSATSNFRLTYAKMHKNLEDLHTVFDFFSDFIKNEDGSKHTKQLADWKKSFVRVYHDIINSSNLSSAEKSKLFNSLYAIEKYNPDETWLDTRLFDVRTLLNGNKKTPNHLKSALEGKNKAVKLLAYAVIDRSLAVAETKKYIKKAIHKVKNR